LTLVTSVLVKILILSAIAFLAAQDYDLCLRLSEVTEVTEISHVDKPLYLYRNDQDNVSHNKQFVQIEFTHKAITGALERRRLADKIELEVQVQPRFVLKKTKID